VLDAAGQVIGFWAADRLASAKHVFPFRLAALDLHGSQPLPGTGLACVAAIELLSDALVRSDIDVLDPAGRPLMRLTGWEDMRFDVPERFRPLTVPTELAPIAHTWERPVTPYADRAITCRRLDARLPTDGAPWKAVWASRVLSRRERETFAALEVPERRQLEWLGARTAAKEGVAELLEHAHGLELLPADIEIVAGEGGAPTVVVPGLEALGETPVVSLSHAQGEAAALAALVAAESGDGIGIDIEHLRPAPTDWADVALSPDERALVDALSPELADEWLLRCWCAKEAAGKAVGSGLAPGRPEAPAVVSIDPEGGRLVVGIGGRRLTAHTLRDGDLVVATALAGEAAAR
jgi:phosphopantetheinyl transferase